MVGAATPRSYFATGDAELIDPTDDVATLASAGRLGPAFATAEVSRLDRPAPAKRGTRPWGSSLDGTTRHKIPANGQGFNRGARI